MTRLPDPKLALQWRERLDRIEYSELTVAQFYQLEGYSTPRSICGGESFAAGSFAQMIRYSFPSLSNLVLGIPSIALF